MSTSSSPPVAIALAPPRGLVVRRTVAADGPTVKVRRRWPLLAVALTVVPFGAIGTFPVAGALLLGAGALTVISTGILDVGSVVLDAGGVRTGGLRFAFAEIERCELSGRLHARLDLVLRTGRRVRLFAGTHRQARWLQQTIESAVAAGAVPEPLPAARALPPPRVP